MPRDFWLRLDHSVAVLSTMKAIQSDPAVLGGTLVFRGTRVPVQTLLDYLSDGFTVEEFLEYFPSVNRVDVVEFLHEVERKAS